MQRSLIASFVVRLFVDRGEGEAGASPCWRVAVRHVQTGEERQFARLAEALAYIEEQAGCSDTPDLR